PLNITAAANCNPSVCPPRFGLLRGSCVKTCPWPCKEWESSCHYSPDWIILSILSYQEQYGNPRPSQMDLGQAVQFALRLLLVAAEFDSATGGVNPETQTYATIKILDGEGV